MIIVFFFFQAEDGIRDLTVTGVQTCALPIWIPGRRNAAKLPCPLRRPAKGKCAPQSRPESRRPNPNHLVRKLPARPDPLFPCRKSPCARALHRLCPVHPENEIAAESDRCSSAA